MRILSKIGVSVLLTAFAVGMSACDWTSGGGGTDFNSSQGVNVNWSGVYKGILGGDNPVGVLSGCSRGLTASFCRNGTVSLCRDLALLVNE